MAPLRHGLASNERWDRLSKTSGASARTACWGGGGHEHEGEVTTLKCPASALIIMNALVAYDLALDLALALALARQCSPGMDGRRAVSSVRRSNVFWKSLTSPS